MNRSPAFQFYPDKWQSHTRRLSDSSYRVFHELVCWMWQHSPDYCSIQASPEAVACAVAMPLQCVCNAMAEIQNTFSPLLKEESGRWISNGLRKESEKQLAKRTQAKTNASARWNNADASLPHIEKNAKASIPQCSPTPTPTPTPTPYSPSEGEKSHKPNPEHQAFIKGWGEQFKIAFGFDYGFTSRDAKAVQLLLRTRILRIDLLEIAKFAWARSQVDCFATNCKKASTIHGFYDFLNQIRVELKNEEHKGKLIRKGPNI